MGHRKHSAPRRGSLAYRPRGRAKRFVPRVRTWPRVSSGAPVLLGFPSFKAGTIHAITTDDREKTPNFGKPLFNVPPNETDLEESRVGKGCAHNLDILG